MESIKKSESKVTTNQQPLEIIKIKAETFNKVNLNPRLLAQIVVSLQSNQRQSAAHTKTRGNVAGSTRKPWRQKGTGRARVGTRRTPLWRGGGVIFGPRKEQNFHKKINKKIILPTLTMVLIKKAQAGELIEIIKLSKEIRKTKEILTLLSKILNPKNNLLVSKKSDFNLNRAAHNIDYIKVVPVNQLNLLDVASAHQIIFFPGAFEVLKTRLSKNK